VIVADGRDPRQQGLKRLPARQEAAEPDQADGRDPRQQGLKQLVQLPISVANCGSRWARSTTTRIETRTHRRESGAQSGGPMGEIHDNKD